jgi:hypothetical protein
LIASGHCGCSFGLCRARTWPTRLHVLQNLLAEAEVAVAGRVGSGLGQTAGALQSRRGAVQKVEFLLLVDLRGFLRGGLLGGGFAGFAQLHRDGEGVLSGQSPAFQLDDLLVELRAFGRESLGVPLSYRVFLPNPVVLALDFGEEPALLLLGADLAVLLLELLGEKLFEQGSEGRLGIGDKLAGKTGAVGFERFDRLADFWGRPGTGMLALHRLAAASTNSNLRPASAEVRAGGIA